MRKSVDLNCDLGEGFGPWPMGDDQAMLDIVTSANIACGFHAGDPLTMLKTVELAAARGVAIGAHPGFDDLKGFGRRRLVGISAREIETLVAYQVGSLSGIAALAGHRVTHVKAHGALSNMASEDLDVAMAIARAIKSVDRSLSFVVLPLTQLALAADKTGLPFVNEIFADRTYEDDGTLTDRKIPGSVIHDAGYAAQRVLEMVREGAVTTRSGKRLKLDIDTICVHGDTPSAVAMAAKIRDWLMTADIDLKPFRKSP